MVAPQRAAALQKGGKSVGRRRTGSANGLNFSPERAGPGAERLLQAGAPKRQKGRTGPAFPPAFVWRVHAGGCNLRPRNGSFPGRRICQGLPCLLLLPKSCFETIPAARPKSLPSFEAGCLCILSSGRIRQPTGGCFARSWEAQRAIQKRPSRLIASSPPPTSSDEGEPSLELPPSPSASPEEWPRRGIHSWHQ